MSLLDDWWISVLKSQSCKESFFSIIENQNLVKWKSVFPCFSFTQPPILQNDGTRGGMSKNLSDYQMSILIKHLFCHKYITKSKVSKLDTKIREEGTESTRNWIFQRVRKKKIHLLTPYSFRVNVIKWSGIIGLLIVASHWQGDRAKIKKGLNPSPSHCPVPFQSRTETLEFGQAVPLGKGKKPEPFWCKPPVLGTVGSLHGSTSPAVQLVCGTRLG